MNASTKHNEGLEGLDDIDALLADVDVMLGLDDAAERESEEPTPARRERTESPPADKRERAAPRRKDARLSLIPARESDPELEATLAAEHKLYEGFQEDGRIHAERVLDLVARDGGGDPAVLRQERQDRVLNRWFLQDDVRRQHPDSQLYAVAKEQLTGEDAAETLWLERTTQTHSESARDAVEAERELAAACRLKRMLESGLVLEHAKAIERIYLRNIARAGRWDKVDPLYRSGILSFTFHSPLSWDELVAGLCPNVRIDQVNGRIHVVHALKRDQDGVTPLLAEFSYKWTSGRAPGLRFRRLTLTRQVTGMREWDAVLALAGTQFDLQAEAPAAAEPART